LISEYLYSLQHQVRLQATGALIRLLNPGKKEGTPAPPHRLALFIAGLLGDSVLCTPVLLEARRLWPDSHITVIGMPHNCNLLSACPEVDEFHAVQVDPFTIRFRKVNLAFRSWLAGQQFDTGIILLGDQFALEMKKAGIPVRIGVQGQPLSPCLTHVYQNTTVQACRPEEKLNSLRIFGHPVMNVRPKLWIDDASRRNAFVALAGMGVAPGEKYGIIHPFGRTPRQRWPVSYCGDLAPLLAGKYCLKVLLLGQAGALFPGQLSTELIDARGKFRVGELPALFAGAEFVISTDSGPFHIAGALGRPLVGLFRSIRPEYASRYPDAKVLSGEDPRCRGRCAWDRCRKLPCRQMASISVGEVLRAVEQAYNGPHPIRKPR
jgi:ADP-heptose:LPS heptosyltransferase